MTGYAAKKQALVDALKGQAGNVRLAKSTSNLFRARKGAAGARLDVRSLCDVIAIDTVAQTVEVEGMTPYARLTDACLAQRCMPLVVPQLKSITIGGAVSGVGIESSSFRYGLPHESVLSMEVLLANGDVVTCTPTNEHADLFFSIPNSYGTLGYILKLTIKTRPVSPWVELSHRPFADADEYFAALEAACSGDADFVDGTVFGEHDYFLTEGRFVDSAPFTSDYTFLDIYYRSIREKTRDYLTVHDYIWRWDTDWFWCSKNLFLHNRLLRRLLGRRRLNSITYQKIMRWNTRAGLTAGINKLLGRQTESVIQDVDIPLSAAAGFLQFFLAAIPIRPIWICPIGGHDPGRHFPLYPLTGAGLFVNFGFWDVVAEPGRHPPGHFNRLVEDRVRALGGVKSLYSDSYYDEETFWALYDGPEYFRVKRKYDPDGRLRNLYQKCVLRE